ncbi:MAG TPA: Fe-S protein assembly co-chaperone HscB [Burkholderiales bacterium]|nr:Fe-S protein assembly co-chaperone HscB [Burkholderiales bacterium]
MFGLPPVFSLDLEALEKAYRDIQSRVHPDRFAHAGDADRRASLQWTTRVNEAFQTLKNPVSRARHLLELQGVDVAFETNTAMPVEFLMQQMELRERLEEAKDPASLDGLRKELSGAKKALEEELAQVIDANKDYTGAAGLVRKLQFLHRLDEEIDAADEALD